MPRGHEQRKLLPELKQVPPLRHGADEHGVIEQSAPEKPGGHVHVKEDPETVQVPPFLHGDEPHG